MRRIKQIAVAKSDNSESLVVLCDDDTIHKYDFAEMGWVLIPPIPYSYAAKMEELEDTMSFFAEEEEDDSSQ